MSGSVEPVQRDRQPTGVKTSLLRKGSWAVADQALLSLSNFITMMLLARGLGPGGFGAFILVYAIMQFANSLQGALITQPHAVLGASRKDDYSQYTGSTALMQLLFSLTAALVALLAAAVCWAADWNATSLLLALVPTVVARQAQEFTRRVLYTEFRTAAAFANDLVSYGCQTAAIALLWWTDWLTGPRALYAVGAASALAAVIGLCQLRRSLSLRCQRSFCGENWRYGKWLVGAEIGYWLSSQVYLIAAGFVLGPAAAGTMKAAYVIFGPSRIVASFLRTALPTWFAHTLRTDGTAGLRRQLKQMYLMVAAVPGAYCMLIALFAVPLVRFLYGENYADLSMLVRLYAAHAFIAFLSSIVNAALRARQQTQKIFAIRMGAILTLPLGFVFILSWGVEGAVLGEVLTALFVNVALWSVYFRQSDLSQHALGRDSKDEPPAEGSSVHRTEHKPESCRPLTVSPDRGPAALTE